uniref:Uncharacterized protein n=1 Tax=Setaria italica TaxID=4555 RepID=K3XZW3_SETIT
MSMGCGAGTREIRPAERTKASSKVRAKARSAFIVWSGESRGRKLGARPHGFLRSQGEKLPLDADVSASRTRREDDSPSRRQKPISPRPQRTGRSRAHPAGRTSFLTASPTSAPPRELSGSQAIRAAGISSRCWRPRLRS